MTQPSWIVDPTDPRAPPQDVWDAMTAEERARVVASLPSEFSIDAQPPEGDPHRKPKERARDALDAFFKRIGRRVYVSSELATYYPDESTFCPDILAVLDVETHERTSWVVAEEGRGLDLVIEIHVHGDPKKDFELNVWRYARLGIPEYFVFDRPRARLSGWRLRPGAREYERIMPQAGRFASEVLGLDLVVEGTALRLWSGTAPLLFMDELVDKLNLMVTELVEARDTAQRRAEEEARRAELEARRAEQEALRADALAVDNASLREQLEKLRRGG